MRIYHCKFYNKLNLFSLNNKDLFYIIIINFITNLSSAKNLYINKINDVILMLA